MLIPLIAMALVASGRAVPGQDLNTGAIKIHELSSGCFHSDPFDYEWTPVDGGFRRGSAFLGTLEVNEMRGKILGASGTPKDLLEQIGFTPAALAAHRAELLDMLWAQLPCPRFDEAIPLSTELERSLAYDSVAAFVLRELTERAYSTSTEHRIVSVEIPGTPVITIRSEGYVPWKLPWKIEVRGKSWESCDVELSRLLLRLVDAEGPNAPLLDGTRYWRDEIWRSPEFWRHSEVGMNFDAWVCRELSIRLEGYDGAIERFRIEGARMGHVGMFPEGVFLEVSTKQPALLEGASWRLLLENGKPKSDWNEFVRVFDAISRSVEGQSWLREWQSSGPERTLVGRVVGREGFDDEEPKEFFLPPWKDSGLRGEPEFEITLTREGDRCGTVWLSSQSRGALILIANPPSILAAEGEVQIPADGHWFDRLVLFFHPMTPTYGRVDDQGRFQLRKIER